uniref:Putative secreted protein n=1 Tax=Anopheles darlingi TaxID=43151 RepID=A0A2M4D2D3_ANODA
MMAVVVLVRPLWLEPPSLAAVAVYVADSPGRRYLASAASSVLHAVRPTVIVADAAPELEEPAERHVVMSREYVVVADDAAAAGGDA